MIPENLLNLFSPKLSPPIGDVYFLATAKPEDLLQRGWSLVQRIQQEDICLYVLYRTDSPPWPDAGARQE